MVNRSGQIAGFFSFLSSFDVLESDFFCFFNSTDPSNWNITLFFSPPPSWKIWKKRERERETKKKDQKLYWKWFPSCFICPLRAGIDSNLVEWIDGCQTSYYIGFLTSFFFVVIYFFSPLSSFVSCLQFSILRVSSFPCIASTARKGRHGNAMREVVTSCINPSRWTGPFPSTIRWWYILGFSHNGREIKRIDILFSTIGWLTISA